MHHPTEGPLSPALTEELLLRRRAPCSCNFGTYFHIRVRGEKEVSFQGRVSMFKLHLLTYILYTLRHR